MCEVLTRMPIPTFHRSSTCHGKVLPTHSRSQRSSRSPTLGVAVVGVCLLATWSTASWLFLADAPTAHVIVESSAHRAVSTVQEAKGPHHGAGFVYSNGAKEVAKIAVAGKTMMHLAFHIGVTTVIHRMQKLRASTCLAGVGVAFSDGAMTLNRVGAACKASIQGNPKRQSNIDFYLYFCFAVWYFGNYQHNICNKLALVASGGAAGFPLTIAMCQLAVGSAYALFLWAAPDARQKPQISFRDWVNMLPVSFSTALAHAGSVFALSAGALSFGQIVKAAEPAFAAGVGSSFYGAKVSTPRLLCLLPIIGGVALSSVSELDFAWAALVAGLVANFAAAVKGNENKKLFSDATIKERIGSTGNQFALTTLSALMFLAPLALYREGHKLKLFMEMVTSDSSLFWNIVLSGWWFYIYNEVATVIIEKTSPVTQSVANTAKRAVVIILGAMVLGESLNTMKLVGCGIAIGGVFLYSEIDKLAAKLPNWLLSTTIA